MSLPELTHDQAKALVSGGYGKETLRNVGRYVVPICWPLSPDDGGERLTNGTAFFVKTPEALFAVTAAHVVRAFLEQKEAVFGALWATLKDMDAVVDLPHELIAIGKKADIATFRVTERVIAKLGKHPMTGWPPKIPQVGKGVVYAGFPGTVRQRTAPREFSFGLVSGGTVADSVTETRIVTSIGRDDLVDTLGHGLPPEDFDFRGMSGGPVLAVVETNVVSWSLAGVISEGTSLLGGILFADLATCIQADGTILE